MLSIQIKPNEDNRDKVLKYCQVWTIWIYLGILFKNANAIIVGSCESSDQKIEKGKANP
jgi:hypothetical protein